MINKMAVRPASRTMTTAKAVASFVLKSIFIQPHAAISFKTPLRFGCIIAIIYIFAKNPYFEASTLFFVM